MNDRRTQPAALPTDLKYTVYASATGPGMPTLWDANARRRDGSFVGGASGDTPAAALAALAREIADVSNA